MMLNHKGAAAYLGVGTTKLYEMVRTGRITFRQDAAGGKRVFDTSDLDAYMSRTKTTTKPAAQIHGTYRKRRAV